VVTRTWPTSFVVPCCRPSSASPRPPVARGATAWRASDALAAKLRHRVTQKVEHLPDLSVSPLAEDDPRDGRAFLALEDLASCRAGHPSLEADALLESKGVLRAERVTGQVAVDALREVETTEGERMMADAFQGFAVSFARYC